MYLFNLFGVLLVLFVLDVDGGLPDNDISSELSSSLDSSSLQCLSDVSMESDGLVIESEASDIEDLGCSLMDVTDNNGHEPESVLESPDSNFFPASCSTPQKFVSFHNIEKVQATPKPVSSRSLLIRETFSSGSKLLQKVMTRKSIMKALLCECVCGNNCMEKFDFEVIKVLRYGYWTRNRQQRTQFLVQTLKSGDKKTLRMENGVAVCTKAYLTILQVNKNHLTICRKLAERGAVSSNGRSFRSVSPRTLQCISWLEQYATFYGDRMPNNNNVLLPYRTAKINVYKTYCRDMKEDGNRAVSRGAFSSIWKGNFPHLKIKQTNSFSKCTICAALERREEQETAIERKEVILKEKSLHNDRQMFERKYYYAKKDASRKHPQQFLSLIIDGMDQSKTNLPHIVGRTPKIINPAELLKTHLTGVLDHGHRKFTIYVDVNQYPHDPNLTMNILLKKLLELARDNGNKLPSFLYLQADNCWRENKNRYVMAFFELLVRENIFNEVHISFLFVGHTHEDVDAGFSRIGEFLRRKDAETLEDLINLIPNTQHLNDMLDIKAWLEPHLNIISKHTVQHHFKFSKVSGETVVEYKLHQAEEWLKQDVTYLNGVPKGKPKILKQDYLKVDFLRLRKLIDSICFMFSDDSKKKWWDKFLNDKRTIKDTGKVIWIDNLPKQQIVLNTVDTSSAIPEPVKKMIQKETQPVKIISKAKRQTVHKSQPKKTTQNQQKKSFSQQKRKAGKKKATVVRCTRFLLIPVDREVKKQIWLRIFMDLLDFLLATAVLLIMTLAILVKYLHIFAIYDILLLLNSIWMAVLVSHLGTISKTVVDNTSFFAPSLQVVIQSAVC